MLRILIGLFLRRSQRSDLFAGLKEFVSDIDCSQNSQRTLDIPRKILADFPDAAVYIVCDLTNGLFIAFPGNDVILTLYYDFDSIVFNCVSL